MLLRSTLIRLLDKKIMSSFNRSGLTAEASKKLPTREPSTEEKRIIDSVSEVSFRRFQCDSESGPGKLALPQYELIDLGYGKYSCTSASLVNLVTLCTTRRLFSMIP